MIFCMNRFVDWRSVIKCILSAITPRLASVCSVQFSVVENYVGAPYLVQFFHIHAVFKKKYQNNRLVPPPLGWRPLLGHPESATENIVEVYSHHCGFWRGSSVLSSSRRICSRPCTALSPLPHLPSDDGNPCVVWSGAGTSSRSRN